MNPSTPHLPASSEAMLTVVIPVFNRARVVEATLRSVQAQTLRPLDVILVDNGSTDGTPEVLRRWQQEAGTPDLRITVLTEPAPGATAARNRGLEAVATPYVMFFDSDDLMAPGHCRRVLDGFLGNPGADIVGWDCIRRNADGKESLLKFSDRDVFWGNIHYGYLSTQRYAARTELFRSIGGWTPDCRGWNDVESGTRLLSLSPKIVKLSGAQTVTVIHTAESITGNAFSAKPAVWEHSLDLMENTVREYHKTNRPAPGCGIPQLKKALRCLNLRRAILAADYTREGDTADGRRLLDAAIAAEPSTPYRLPSPANH